MCYRAIAHLLVAVQEYQPGAFSMRQMSSIHHEAVIIYALLREEREQV
jgi:hypothetical protein